MDRRCAAEEILRESEQLRIALFDEEVEPVPGVTVARIGGHFDGAAVLHWAAGSGGAGVLLTGNAAAWPREAGYRRLSR